MSNEFDALISQLEHAYELDQNELTSVIRQLGQLNEERVIWYLITVLGCHENSKPNEAASQELVKFGAKAVEPLLESLPPSSYHPRDSWRRFWVISTLGFLRDDRAFEPLLDTLNNTDDISIAAAVALALQKFQDKRGLEPLQAAMRRLRAKETHGGYSYSAIFGAINYLGRRGR